MRIFTPTIKDVQTICDIGSACFMHTFLGIPNTYYTKEIIEGYNAQAFAPEKIKSELLDPKTHYFLLEVEDKIVGYLKLMEKEPEDCVRGKNPLYLERVYLLESHIGKGLGMLLMNKAY